VTVQDSANAIFKVANSGTGSFTLSQHGSLEFGAGDSQKVTFAPGATGTLKIDHSLTAPFTGYVSGLSTKNAIDLVDLTWSKQSMTATYAGSASGGTLTVSNGTNSVKLNLLGDYRTASWSLSKDKNGGTLVVDPPITGSHTSTDSGDGASGIDFSGISFGAESTLGYSPNSDSHRGTLITDPPITSGGSVGGTDPEVSPGSGFIAELTSEMAQFAQKIEDCSSGNGLVASVASGMMQVAQKIEDSNSNTGGTIDPSHSPLQWLENFCDTVVSDLHERKTVSGFDQLVQQLDNRSSAASSGSTPSDHSNFQIPGFAAVWESHMIQTLASFVDGKGGSPQDSAMQLNDQNPQPYLAANVMHHS
jgi:hypothetical protein